MKYILGILVFVLTFTSCGTMKFFNTSDFTAINDVKDLNGHYLNREARRSILSNFNISEYADFVTITSENPNEIKLIYHTDSGKREVVFNGEMKQNYFEIYFAKQQFIIPLLYSNCYIDRIRIGKLENGKLLILKFTDNSGNLLMFGAGYSYETPYIFSHSYEYKEHIPIQENGLWGYSDSLGNVVIPHKYDFATMFEYDVARVKSNGEWGLINKQGAEVIPLEYDEVLPFGYPPAYRVSTLGKMGVFDKDGNELIPVIYDHIDTYFERDIVRIRLKDKWGYANRTQVVVPAIYTKTLDLRWADGYFFVERNGKKYVVDEDGYEYETYKGTAKSKYDGAFYGANLPILETKRKIEFDEQEIK